jgi:CTP synthase
LSVTHALTHAAIEADCKLVVRWIDSTHLEDETKATALDQWTAAWDSLRGAHGVLVPGGFGDRGISGKILAVNYARTSKKPFLGICLGLQVAVVEFARNVCGMSEAHSTEFAPHTPEPVVVFMPEGSTEIKGGTMRLGSRCTNVKSGTLAWQLYDGNPYVHERHRHRYEVNPKMVTTLEAKGMVFSGIDDAKERMEVMELPASIHPFFLGLQAHPEFKSRPLKPSPPFRGLILASAGKFVRRDVPRRVVSLPQFAASQLLTQSLASTTPGRASGRSRSPSPSPRVAPTPTGAYFSTPAGGLFPPPVTATGETEFKSSASSVSASPATSTTAPTSSATSIQPSPIPAPSSVPGAVRPVQGC